MLTTSCKHKFYEEILADELIGEEQEIQEKKICVQ